MSVTRAVGGNQDNQPQPMLWMQAVHGCMLAIRTLTSLVRDAIFKRDATVGTTSINDESCKTLVVWDSHSQSHFTVLLDSDS
jgi:hypothetical protein